MAAAKSKKKKKTQKQPQKAPVKAIALTWEELLVEKALAMITETDRQISESAGRFEQKMREKNRQINESAELYKQKMKESSEQAGVEANEISEQIEYETKEGGKKTRRKIKGGAEQPGQPGHIDMFDRFYQDPVGKIDSPNLMRKLSEMGFVFDKSYKDAVINDKKNNISVEIDITLEGGNKVMIVEAMTRPSSKDISEHIERIKKARRYADLHGDKRKYFGAISGTNFSDSEKSLIMKNGLYVIEPSGKSFIITAPKGGYSPREW